LGTFWSACNWDAINRGTTWMQITAEECWDRMIRWYFPVHTHDPSRQRSLKNLKCSIELDTCLLIPHVDTVSNKATHYMFEYSTLFWVCYRIVCRSINYGVNFRKSINRIIY
jgi:hypothetical protein